MLGRGNLRSGEPTQAARVRIFGNRSHLCLYIRAKGSGSFRELSSFLIGGSWRTLNDFELRGHKGLDNPAAVFIGRDIMHRVLQLAVLVPMVAWSMSASHGQSILEGGFGAAKESKPKPRPARKAVVSQQATVPKTGRVTKESSAPSRKRYPYHGKFDRFDEVGKAIVLAGKTKERVILITSGTNITRDGKRASLTEAVKGEKVSGSVVKNAEGREQALTVRLRGLQ